MQPKNLPCLLVLLVCAPSAFAADIFHFGIAPSVAMVSVKDPDGSTKSSATASLTNFLVTQSVGRDRLLYQGYYQTFSPKAGISDIGQNVEIIGVNISGQMALRNTRRFSLWAPWAGLGLGAAQGKYKLRHTIDQDGYLLNEYADRSRLNYYLVGNLSNEWALKKGWSTGVTLQYQHPIAGDIKLLSIAFTILY